MTSGDQREHSPVGTEIRNLVCYCNVEAARNSDDRHTEPVLCDPIKKAKDLGFREVCDHFEEKAHQIRKLKL